MNKKIKIIDLLNMIAEGEELPNKIIFDTNVYRKINAHTYIREKPNGITISLFDEYILINCLNDTVEIIEEDNNKIERLIINEAYKFSSSTIKDFTMEDKRLLDSNFKTLSDKINEIIDKINKENNI